MGDTIRRQAAIDELMAWEEDSFWDDECLKHRGEPYWVAPSDVIERMPSVQQWIPCSERLPEERQDVYVTVFWDGYGDTITAYGMRTQFGWLLWNTAEGELLKGYTVTAWMPLPKPYGERKDNGKDIQSATE